jgi:hypothetical protein
MLYAPLLALLISVTGQCMDTLQRLFELRDGIKSFVGITWTPTG